MKGNTRGGGALALAFRVLLSIEKVLMLLPPTDRQVFIKEARRILAGQGSQ